jgi:hypothetical protein
MDVIAVVLATLKTNHRAFIIRLIDAIIEEILRGMERNDFKES